MPLTWPRHGGQVPIFYAQRPSGRPTQEGVRYTSSYRDISASPQFPFGHGLSYSRFTLTDLQCEPSTARAGESVQISVAIRNDGPTDGEATLFLFTHDRVASIARPLMELKETCKIVLAAGANDRATWTLPVQALSFLGPDLEPVLEPGQFDILVGQETQIASDMLSCAFELLWRDRSVLFFVAKQMVFLESRSASVRLGRFSRPITSAGICGISFITQS